MKQHNIKLPVQLYERLEREAARLDLDLEFLAAGLIKSFLDKQEQGLTPAPTPGGGKARRGKQAEVASVLPKKAASATAEESASDPGENCASADEQDRRTHSRTKVALSAMLYFKTDNGRSVVYKAGGLRDIGPGGGLLECGQQALSEQEFAPGRQFELIFQLNEAEAPVHVQCEICRVDRLKDKTRLGVAFKGAGSRLNIAALRELADKG